ncbi:MAG: outer membrane beta-barrel protein [Rikenellaceae bacterium]
MKKIKDLLSLVALLFVAVTAQGATIKGMVVDSATKEPLLGATVFVLNTTQGVTTDLDGAFEMKLNRGQVQLEVSYISYLTQIIEVDVNGKTPDLVIELVSDAQSISEVMVTTRKNLESEAALQNERIASHVAIENMGAKEMSLKGLSNVQEGVKKLTGISVASAGQLIVRGLGDRYSITTLNGQPIASPNPDNKLIPLDIFPSSTVKNITVSKVYDAKTYADYSGAHVDIATKDLTSDDFFSVGFSVGGNSNTTFQDFYGMDNVSMFSQSKLSDEIIDYANTNYEVLSYVENNDDAFDTGFSVGQSSALPTFGGNVAWGHSYDVGAQNLSVLISGGVSNDKQTDLNSKYIVYEKTGNATDEYYSDNYESTLKVATLGNIGLTMREDDRVSYTFFYARNASDKYSLRSGNDYEDGFNMVFSNNVTHIYKLSTHQLNGKHELGEKVTLNWTGSYTATGADEPDRRQVAYASDGDGNLQFFTDKTQATMRFFGELDEDELNGNIYADYGFGEAHKVTLGAAYRQKEREYVGRYFYYQMKSRSDYPYTDPYAADDYITTDNMSTITPSFLDKDSYDAGSTIISTYASTDLSFDKWLINAGLRYEFSEQYVNYNTRDSRSYPEADLFPALNVRYSIDDKRQLRLSSSRTVTRPSFIEMAPLQYQESYGSAQIKGNADLVNGYNYNVDLRYETFFEGGDMFSVTGYYKHLDSPIERIQSVSGGGEVHTFNNAEDGVAAGVEIEARKTIIDNLKLGVNGSYMYTNVTLAEDGSYTNSSRELQGASPYLVNADLTYAKYLDDEGRTMSLALLYNLQGPRIQTVGTSGRGDIYQLAEHTLNFNFAYSISSSLQLSAQLTNLLNRDQLYEQEISGVKYIVESHNYGIGASIGLSLKF